MNDFIFDPLFKSGNILFFTSFIFITNTLAALYTENYFYAFLFYCLTITSLIYHSTHTMYANVIDKIVIAFIFFYGAYNLYIKSHKSIILNICIFTTFLFCIFVYIYGFLKSEYCFHSDECMANSYHTFMHIIGSLGHHLIIFL